VCLRSGDFRNPIEAGFGNVALSFNNGGQHSHEMLGLA